MQFQAGPDKSLDLVFEMRLNARAALPVQSPSYVRGMCPQLCECRCSHNFVLTSVPPYKALASNKVKLLSLWHSSNSVLSPIVVFGMLAHTEASRTTHVVISDML